VLCNESVQASATTLSPSEVTRNEPVQASATTPSPVLSETQGSRFEQVPHNERVQASATTPSSLPFETQRPRNEHAQSQIISAVVSPSEIQTAPSHNMHNNQIQGTVTVPPAPVKKPTKMRPGSSNTPR
jgi:hypothetical protein